ncbi:hypothetical protein TrVE_jg13388 [Triparma verrucosa]|uniref:Serine hydroxymethyltransferase n=1 Tax=Triparma verrucosa TaxID=1606542 RepID=A0A9W7BTM3_9STRA|nr:hypothetical protein TrVE_jg13388 [Triparma verrucosa]
MFAQFLLFFLTITGSSSVVAAFPPSSSSCLKRSEQHGSQLRTFPLDDPEVSAIILSEQLRQRRSLELIASENFASSAVLTVLGSCLTNKYSEGQPSARYYAGNVNIDVLETLTKSRALGLYGLSSESWAVNVQPYSGSPANFAVYTALLNPHDRIMGLDLPSGGHLTHGYYTSKKKVSATSVYFESLPYKVDEETGLIDYDEMEKLATVFRPKLLIAGGSAYPREWDYARMRAIADSVGAYFLVDMAHLSGLVASAVVDSPFEFADVVTTTTHKSLRGPRSGMIFSRKEFSDEIDKAVFPGLQGGPHNNNIGALCVALKEADSEEFKTYAKQVIKNAKVLSERLMEKGMKLATGGTSNHLMLWDVRPLGLSGSKVEKVLERCSITLNKNSLHGDTSAVNPGGVRIGVCALTSRGMKEEEMGKVAEWLVRGSEIAAKVQNKTGKKLADFKVGLEDPEFKKDLEGLKNEVEEFAETYYMPGQELQEES